MHILKTTVLAASLLVLFSVETPAADLRLAAAGPNDQTVRQLVPADLTLATAALDRAPASVSWALDPAVALASTPRPFVRESREFWINANQGELRAGVHLPTTATQAIIRISPHENNSTTLKTDDLVIRANGRQYSAAEATVSIADTQALRQAGMDVPDGTVVFKLAGAVGKGEIDVAIASAQGDYLLHVFEPTSSQVLKLGATRDTIVAGDPISIDAGMLGAQARHVTGVLTAPDGHTQAFAFAAGRDGGLHAVIVPDAAHAGGPGLWEVHAFAAGQNGRQQVLRDAKTAFAVTRATARLDGTVERLQEKSAGLALQVGVEAASASRYQLAGVLYGTAKDGSRQPAAYAQSAAWLQTGRSGIVLRFDAPALNGSGLSPPYELRDLRLSNQIDMSVIERRERAIELN